MKALLLSAAAVSLCAGVASYHPALVVGQQKAVGDVVPASPEAVLARMKSMRMVTALEELSPGSDRSELRHLVTEDFSLTADDEAELDVTLFKEHVLTIRATVTRAGSERSRVAVAAKLVPSRLTMSPHLLDSDRAHIEALVAAIARAYIVRTFEPAISNKELEQRFAGSISLPRQEQDGLLERVSKALLTSYPDQIRAAEGRVKMDHQRAYEERQRSYERLRGLEPGTAPPAWEVDEAAERAEAEAGEARRAAGY